MTRKTIMLLPMTQQVLEKMGAYASVLAVLEMDKDFEKIALDEKGKQKYQDLDLYRRERATRDNRQINFNL